MTASTRGTADDVPVDAASADAIFDGPGEVRAVARALDWGATPLGWPDAWSPALRVAARAMLDAPFPICLWAGPAYALVYNDAYRRILAAKHPAALGQPGSVVWAEIWAGLEPQFAQVRGGGPPVFFEDARFEMARLEGGGTEHAWFSYSLSALREEDGGIVAVLNISPETTARVQAERALAAANAQLQDQQVELELSNQQLQDQAADLEELTAEANEAREQAEAERVRATAILEAMTDAYFALDPTFHIVAVNAAMERSTGRARDALLGRLFWDVFPGAVGTLYEQHYRAAADEGIVAHFTHDYSDGRLDLVSEADVYPVAGGGVAVFWRDITSRVQSEAERDRLLAAERAARAEAEAARAQSDAVLGSITDPFILLDRDWRIMQVNDAAEPPLRPGRGRLLGRTLWDAFPGLEGSPFEPYYRDAMATGRPTAVEDYFAPLDTWFDVRIYPWSGGLMVHFRDVSARKATEAEREQLLAGAQAARADAEEASRAKAEFLATMSHELRTPINAVLGYAQLLEVGVAGPLTEQQRGFLERLTASGQHLLGLVSDVLDLAKVDAGAARVLHEDAMTGPAVRAALDLVAPAAATRGVRLVDGRRDEAGVPYVGDEDRVRQVTLNLLSNAVKFTSPGGTVTVTCDTVPDTPAAAGYLKGDGPWALVRVEDTGVGIPPEEQGRIFDEFHQVEGGHTRTAGGTGLGLAISRRLARLMGGDLTVQSTPGAGSAFTLWLPASRRGATPSAGGETAAERAERAERDVSRLDTPGLGEVGGLLRGAVDEILVAYTDRLRADPAIPQGATMTRVALEDHAVSFLADLAQSLLILDTAGTEGAELLRAGSAIQRTIAEEHGARRYAQGWDEAALRRDQRVFREEVERAVRERLKAGSVDVEEAVQVLLGLMERGEAISVRAWRRGAAAASR